MSKVLPSATALVSKHLEAGFLETAIGDCLLWFSHGRCLFHSVSWRRAIRQKGRDLYAAGDRPDSEVPEPGTPLPQGSCLS